MNKYPEHIDIPVGIYQTLNDGSKIGDFKFYKLAHNWLLITPNGFEYRDYPQPPSDYIRFVPVMTAKK